MYKIYVKEISKNHRGVFAKTKFKKGEIIEQCPVIIVPKKDQKLIDKTHIFSYYFYWGPKHQPAIALGYGSLYNHSYEPNIEYDENIKKKVMVFKALRDIKKGEELLSNYNGDTDSKEKLWFKVKNLNK